MCHPPVVHHRNPDRYATLLSKVRLERTELIPGATPVPGHPLCHRWTGRKNRNGYGTLGSHVAHKAMWQESKGRKVPKGHLLDHLCRVRDCINEHHLEPVTPKVNTLRGEGPSAHHARKTTCKRGHQLPEARNGQGRRECMACRKLARQVKRDRKAIRDMFPDKGDAHGTASGK